MEILHCLTLLLIVSPSFALQLYSEPNYTGVISRNIFSFFSRWEWEERPTGCFTFPQVFRRTLSSVKTDSRCVIFYEDTQCRGRSFRVDRVTPSIANLQGSVTHDNFDNTASSFRYCNRDEGLETVDVQLFQNAHYSGASLSYDSVCKCVSVPKELATIRSIDNHHHCIRLFTSTNCDANEGETATILPGKTSVSEDMSTLEIFGNVGSFRPCEISANCFKFSIVLFEAAVEESKSKLKQKTTSDFLSMSARTTFYNNGSAYVTQEYSASKKVREVTEIGRVNFTRIMTSWKAEETTERGVSLDVGFKVGKLPGMSVGVGLIDAVTSAYSDVCQWAEQTTENYIYETSSEFSVRQEIEVPPCTMYDVDSFISVQSNLPLEYKLFFRMRGEFDRKQMTAEELIEELRSMEEYRYNHTVDDYTVVAYATSTMTASFGVDTEIRGEGFSIRNCIK